MRRTLGGLGVWLGWSLAACAVGTNDGGSAGIFGPSGESASATGSATLDPLDPDVDSAEDGSGGATADSGGVDGPTSMTTSTPPGTGDDTAGDDDSEPPAGECGNGVVEGDEDCDGSDLGAASCADFGFSDGVLACGAECHLLTDACFTCGDGQISLAEVCDGADFGGDTCQSLGFGGGALTCSADCQTVVTDGCQPLPSCGDGVLNGGEQCDGASLGGNTCITQGFDMGQIACTASCVLDVSGCEDDLTNCGGQGDFCLFDENDLQSTCCPPGVNGNVLGICDVLFCV